jgi:hypothetical protein
MVVGDDVACPVPYEAAALANSHTVDVQGVEVLQYSKPLVCYVLCYA